MADKKAPRAIFLDRDGTIIEDRDYLADPEEVTLIPGSAGAIKMINEMGYKAIVVTNQSGVARGYFPEEQIAVIHRHLAELLRKEGAIIDAFYYCPHHPASGKAPYREDCGCRKPEKGMIEAAVRDFNIDLTRSYVVGDKAADVELAQRSGAGGILVKTGYGMETAREIAAGRGIEPVHVAADLYHAVCWIKTQKEQP